MRIILLFSCSITILLSCHGESKQARNHLKVSESKSIDSLVKFVSLDFLVHGKPCNALINQGYKNFKEKKDFPLSLFITINTIEKDSIGHPTDKEAKIFNSLESEILSQLVSETCYIGQTTMNGYRDMIFYIASKDLKNISEKLKIIKQKHSRIKSYTFEEDPEWEAVSEFYSAIS